MHKNFRDGNVERLVNALKQLGYVSYKPPHEYKRGKFHVGIKTHSNTRCTLTLHRDRLRWLGGHEAVWEGPDLREEMNRIMTKYKCLKSRF